MPPEYLKAITKTVFAAFRVYNDGIKKGTIKAPPILIRKEVWNENNENR